MGHSNRVFGVKFTEDPNILISGGWDNVIFLWDIRMSKSVSYFYGPHLCGNSIDVRGDILLTGSYSNKEVLQLWSITQRKLIETIKWDPGQESEYDHGYLYTAVFDKGVAPSKYIAAGGAGGNECRIFKNSIDYQLLGKISFNKAVTGIDFCASKKVFAVSCGDGFTYLFAYDDSSKLE